MSKLLTILLAATFSSQLSATVFKCSDLDGVVSFQDLPCKTISIEEIIALPPTAAGPENDTVQEQQDPALIDEDTTSQSEPSRQSELDNI